MFKANRGDRGRQGEPHRLYRSRELTSIASSRISGTSLMRACGFHLDTFRQRAHESEGKERKRERKLKTATGPTSAREDLPTPAPPPLLSQGSGISFHSPIKSRALEFTGVRWRGGGQLRQKRPLEEVRHTTARA